MKKSKKRIYLDIDGVLLDYRTGQPAEHAQTLIDFITSGRYDVYWLTTHCKGDSTQTMEYLSRHFSGRTLKKLGKIKATEWDTLKTEAIDPGCDFIWIDDYPFQAEIAALDAIRRRDSLCRVDLCREDELLNVISFIKNHGRNPSRVPHRRPRWKIYALAAVLLLACLFIYREARPFIWRMVNRPGDRMETHVLHAGRGDLLDTDGNVIATSRTVYDIHFDCCMIESEAEWNEKSRMLAQEIATIPPERTAPQWWDYFQKGRKNRRRHVPIAKDIDLSMADTLRTLTLFSRGKRGGFICTSKEVRTYPYGELGRRAIGAWNRGTGQYLFGVEQAMDEALRGEDGYIRKKIGRRRGRNVQWTVETKESTDGKDIHTTLCMAYQAMADSVLRQAVESDEDIAGGCLMLMEVGTGAIISMANMHRLENGKVGEYFNYALDYSYEPGAVAQTMTLACALSDRLFTSLDQRIPTRHGIPVNGILSDPAIRRYESAHRTDSISVIDGLSISSRYVASHIASMYSPTPDYFLDWYRTFCVSPSEFTHGTMPGMRMTSKGEDGMTDLMSIGAGYGFTMCPLQILTFYNTVANGGRMMLPMLVKGTEDETDGYLTVLPREREERVLRQEVADTLRRALAACVEDGTGKRLSGMPLQMAGKTGTSRQIIDPELRGGSADPYHDQERRSQYASTFAGFYPADEPHYSVMCVLFTRPTHQIYPGGSLPAETVLEFVSRIEAVR